MKNRCALILLFLLLCLILTACGSGEGGGDKVFRGGGGGGSSNDNTVRASVHSDGSEGNRSSNSSSISSNGRFVAFVSSATNLVSGTQNSSSHIYVHDRDSDNDGIYDETGAITTVRVSVDSNGTIGNRNSSAPSISDNGKVVAFESLATNLVANDNKGVSDIFIHDLTSTPGTTTRVSVDSSGTEADNASFAPSISDDGNFVAFESIATNLVANDNKNVSDVFIHDLTSTPGTTTRVSVDSSGTEADNVSFAPSISADGKVVAFESLATNLVANDNKGVSDIFVHNRNSTPGTTTRVSVDSSGIEANNGSFAPSVNSDGNFVAFESIATNLVVNDTLGHRDIFVNKP
jgi:predicted small secreted protein